MTDPSSQGGAPQDEEIKKVPGLRRDERRGPGINSTDDAASEEAKLFSAGDTREEFKADAKSREEDRAEAFRDQFELISIIALWFATVVFGILTFVWMLNLILPKCWQFVDSNQEDKIQLIITGGFVAGIASSHIKKRLG